MRKKILVDIYLAYNLGDDMFLDHLATRYPDYDFVPYHPGKNYTDFYQHYDNVQQFPYSFADKIKARLGADKLKDYGTLGHTYDGLLFLGGGIFREESYWREVYQYRTEITEAFKLQAKPVWMMGCNFGPFHTAEFKEAYGELFKKVTKIHFRDRKSYSLFSDLQIAGYFPDILWDYRLPVAERKEKVLGISLINPRHKEGKGDLLNGYVNAHCELILKYMGMGYQIRLFSFCEREGDMETARLIKERIPTAEILNYTGNITGYLQHIGECSHFVAARFHAVIIAAKYGIPIIPVIYSTKTENLLDDLGYTRIKIHLENINEMNGLEFVNFEEETVKNVKKQAKEHLIL